MKFNLTQFSRKILFFSLLLNVFCTIFVITIFSLTIYYQNLNIKNNFSNIVNSNDNKNTITNILFQKYFNEFGILKNFFKIFPAFLHGFINFLLICFLIFLIFSIIFNFYNLIIFKIKKEYFLLLATFINFIFPIYGCFYGLKIFFETKKTNNNVKKEFHKTNWIKKINEFISKKQ